VNDAPAQDLRIEPRNDLEMIKEEIDATKGAIDTEVTEMNGALSHQVAVLTVATTDVIQIEIEGVQIDIAVQKTVDMREEMKDPEMVIN